MSDLLPLFLNLTGRAVLLVGGGRVATAKLQQLLAAATPAVNREVAAVAETERVFVNAVDDPANASAFLSGVVRRDGVTLAISTSGDAPALTALLREGLDALLPRDLGSWVWRARAERVAWRREGVPMEQRKPLLLRALNSIYGLSSEHARDA